MRNLQQIYKPKTIDEAVALLKEPDTALLAGGTGLLSRRDRRVRAILIADHPIVDISRPGQIAGRIGHRLHRFHQRHHVVPLDVDVLDLVAIYRSIGTLLSKPGSGIGAGTGSGIGTRSPGGGKGTGAELPGTGGTGLGYGRGSGIGIGEGSGIGDIVQNDHVPDQIPNRLRSVDIAFAGNDRIEFRQQSFPYLRPSQYSPFPPVFS